MICPVEIADEMSALRAARVGDHAKHGFLPEGRDGAGDESSRRDVASDGEEDYLVAGGRDTGYQRPAQGGGSLRTQRGLSRTLRAGCPLGQQSASPENCAARAASCFTKVLRR